MGYSEHDERSISDSDSGPRSIWDGFWIRRAHTHAMLKYAGLLITAAGGLITIIGGIVTAIQKVHSDNQSSRKVLAFQTELGASQKLLAQKSDEIASLTKRNVDILTGGDGYCYLLPASYAGARIIHLFITNRSTFNQYDVNCYVSATVDVTKLPRKRLPQELVDKAIFGFTYNAGDVPIQQAMSEERGCDYPILDGLDDVTLNVTIAARNGVVEEKIRAKDVGGGYWVFSFSIRRAGKVLIEQIFPGVPLEWTT